MNIEESIEQKIVGFVAENDNAFIRPENIVPFNSLEHAEKFWAEVYNKKKCFVVEAWEAQEIVNSWVLEPQG